MMLSSRVWALCLALVACRPDLKPQDSAVQAVGIELEMVYVQVPLARLTPAFVQATRFNRDHRRDAVFAFGYLERPVFEALPEALLDGVVELEAEDLTHGAPGPHDRQAATASPGAESVADEDYHDYAALTAALNDIADRHPDIVHLESAGQSVQGRELWLVKISDQVEVDEDEPKLLYIANMHGDEVVGRELMLYLARLLTEQYAASPRIRQLVDHAQIYIMPSMNPDGFEARRRFNSRGVDLNRDFPDFSSDPYDSPGGRAPETQAIMALHAAHQFTLAANLHGGEVCFNLPWDTAPNTFQDERFGDDPLLATLAREYADLNPAMRRNSGGSFDRGVTYGYEWYEVDGGMQDWAIHYRHSTHATLELSLPKWPDASMLSSLWADNQEPLLRYLERGIAGVHLHVTGPGGEGVGTPKVRVASTYRDLPLRGQRLTRLTLPGLQTVTVSAPGYQSRQFNLMARPFEGSFESVTLARTLNADADD